MNVSFETSESQEQGNVIGVLRFRVTNDDDE